MPNHLPTDFKKKSNAMYAFGDIGKTGVFGQAYLERNFVSENRKSE